ncbi:MAG: ExbD/TolR family protein [Desulfovibrionales bacterium]
MEFERRRRPSLRMDIAPLVDVIFLLLLFFVLTFHFSPDRALEITLPEADSAAAHDSDGLVLSIDRSETVHLNGTPVRLDALGDELQKLPFNRPETVVTIRTHRDIPVGLLVAVVDAVQQSGFSSFGIVATPSEPSPN